MVLYADKPIHEIFDLEGKRPNKVEQTGSTFFKIDLPPVRLELTAFRL